MGWILVKADEVETFKRTHKGALGYSSEGQRGAERRAREIAADHDMFVTLLWEDHDGDLHELGTF